MPGSTEADLTPLDITVIKYSGEECVAGFKEASRE
jgi:hypothetical protein